MVRVHGDEAGGHEPWRFPAPQAAAREGPRQHDGGRPAEEAQPAAGDDEVGPEPVQRRQHHDLEEVRVALDALARVVDEPLARREVARVPERDERVVGEVVQFQRPRPPDGDRQHEPDRDEHSTVHGPDDSNAKRLDRAPAVKPAEDAMAPPTPRLVVEPSRNVELLNTPLNNSTLPPTN